MNKIGILYGYWCTEWDVDYSPYLEKGFIAKVLS